MMDGHSNDRTTTRQAIVAFRRFEDWRPEPAEGQAEDGPGLSEELVVISRGLVTPRVVRYDTRNNVWRGHRFVRGPFPSDLWVPLAEIRPEVAP